IGEFHPGHRADTERFKKRRRNSRILEKFYDARYTDLRDGKVKSGGELGCQRTSRSEPRMSEKNLRVYRANKVKRGSRNIRAMRCPVQAGDLALYKGERIPVKGTHKGTNVEFSYPARGGKKSCSIKKIRIARKAGGWIRIKQ
ncbi:MAG: hypothetical protein NC489_39165, partial [Ruminococcus flavefaciens]|nr:hypothetical protein [Ruminococcus flavefaciens]